MGDELRSRERTLAWAVALSAWAPLATAAAWVLGRSTTQAAEAVRRSVELVALVVAWWVVRRARRCPDEPAAARARAERVAVVCVTAALAVSAVAIGAWAIVRVAAPAGTGDVRLGLAIAALGLLVNLAFWRRYAAFERARPHPVIGAQRRLYGAKAWVDAAVVVALATVAVAPGSRGAHLVDVGGSLAVAAYLAVTALRRSPIAPHEAGARG